MSAADTSHLSIDNSSVFREVEAAESTEQEAQQDQEQATESDEGESQAGEGEAEQTDSDAEAGAPQDAEDDLEALIEKFAKEHSLNLNDKEQRKLAKRLADREITYRTQKAEIDKLKNAPKTDYLADFEKSLEPEPKETTSKAEVKTETREEPKQGEWKPIPYKDLGEPYENDEELYSALNDAWRDGDFKKVAKAEEAKFKHNVVNKLVPLMRAMVEARLADFRSKDLEADLKPVRETAEQRMDSDARERALTELRKLPEFKGTFDEMFKVEGEDLEYQGQRVDNNAINRIFTENPELLDIRKSHADPFKAAAMTHFARLLAAGKIFLQQKKAKSITSTKAKELVESGAKMAQRESGSERVRQSLNSGSGASGRTPPAKQNYAKELNDLPGARSLASLFSK